MIFLTSFADINECEDPTLNNCTSAKNCVNTEGSYHCRCPKWHHGKGRKDGEGCDADLLLVLKIAIGKYIYELYYKFSFFILSQKKNFALSSSFFFFYYQFSTLKKIKKFEENINLALGLENKY